MTSPRKSVSGTELRVTVPIPRVVRMAHDEGLASGAITTLSRTVSYSHFQLALTVK